MVENVSTASNHLLLCRTMLKEGLWGKVVLLHPSKTSESSRRVLERQTAGPGPQDWPLLDTVLLRKPWGSPERTFGLRVTPLGISASSLGSSQARAAPHPPNPFPYLPPQPHHLRVSLFHPTLNFVREGYKKTALLHSSGLNHPTSAFLSRVPE